MFRNWLSRFSTLLVAIVYTVGPFNLTLCQANCDEVDSCCAPAPIVEATDCCALPQACCIELESNPAPLLPSQDGYQDLLKVPTAIFTPSYTKTAPKTVFEPTVQARPPGPPFFILFEVLRT